MNDLYKVKAKWFWVSTFGILTVLLTHGMPTRVKGRSRQIKFFVGQDTIPSTDTTIVPVTDTVPIKFSKDSLDGPVTYHADDSLVMDIPEKKIYLYGKDSKTDYLENHLTAPGIVFDQRTNLVMASLRRDSSGKAISFPTFTQADFKSVSDTILFNMKTGKGLTKGTYTKQDEMYIFGETIKKVDADVFYAYQGRFTTCNLDTPHFAFVSKRIKFINKKMAITGPVHPEFEGVPLPIVLPFGLYPLRQGRHSGLIAPAFTANEQLGLALEGLGYYKVLNDNWDVTLRGTLYSYGGFTANVSPRYYKRYRYRGNFSLDYQRFKTNFKGDPDFSLSKTFNIRWSHQMDQKARPGVTFNANVNAGSTRFNQLVPNSPQRNFTNQLNSTISYSRVWKEFNIMMNAAHSQNTNTRLISVTLPDLSFNLNTQYPFRRKEVVGKLKWYENIGIALNSNIKSLTDFTDDTALSKLNVINQAVENLRWGANHNIPITLSLPQLGPITIAPIVSYTERWYQEKFQRSWNSTTQKIDTSISNGFYTARDMSFGLTMATRIFGMFTFGKRAAVKAIRHEIRPSVTINYKPDMNGRFYYSTQIDTSGRQARYNVFERSIFTAFGEGRFGGLNFNIDNNIQMKVRNRKDTAADAVKKVTLLDGLSLSGGYNFLRDSFQFTVFNLNARTNLFEKINITASAILDPYQVNANGERINRLVWRDKLLTLGRMTSANVSMSTSFQGGDKKKKPRNPAMMNPMNNTGMPLDEWETEAALISNNPAEFADFSIPWSVNLAYSLQFNRVRTPDQLSFRNVFNQDVNWNGTLNLTPKWQLGVNGFYNITNKELGTVSVSIAREMHCWQMAINLSPVGRYRFFNITISPKSALLRDLRVNRTRYFFDL